MDIRADVAMLGAQRTMYILWAAQPCGPGQHFALPLIFLPTRRTLETKEIFDIGDKFDALNGLWNPWRTRTAARMCIMEAGTKISTKGMGNILSKE